MSPYNYRIKFASPTSVRDDLLRVWQSNLPIYGEEAAKAKFSWTYENALHQPEGVFVLAARDQGQEDQELIVGTAGLGMRNFFAKGHVLRAGLLGDLAVESDHRTLLPAVRLVRESRKMALRDFDFAYGFPNEAAEGVFERCGYHRLGTLQRYVMILRYHPYVRRIIDVPMLPKLAGAVLTAGRAAVHLPAWMHAHQRYSLHLLDNVDVRFDEMWQRVRGEYPLIGERDQSFLRWRFFRQPNHDYRIACITDRQDDHTVHAYAVIETEGVYAYIRDFFGARESLSSLFELLAVHLARNGMVSMSVDYLGGARMIAMFKAHGFVPRQATQAIIMDASASCQERAEWLRDVDNWHLTDADEDT